MQHSSVVHGGQQRSALRKRARQAENALAEAAAAERLGITIQQLRARQAHEAGTIIADMERGGRRRIAASWPQPDWRRWW
ncbi:hypothetical protein C4571_00615 [Candidatus Parcubacteria bacterium]|nr:MAG: hypothetical protein C4571_00615 [Candidatus Parcubacteria bacterium]